MSKFKKSQILMLLLLAALLFVTPLLSASLRPKYLYLIINLLIIALGAEAGLLSSLFSRPILEDKNKIHAVSVPVSTSVPPDQPKVVQKSVSEKITGSVKVVEKLKKCPSVPSLFFIGGGLADEDHLAEKHQDQEEEEEEEEEEIGEISGQELFTKAETFIGNFYKQLKMQREESWKRIHGFYQKAF